MEYDVIIGLEIHAELKTKSKMFCSCDNDSENKKPNVNVCPICLGHPGTLPLPNKQAIEWTILTGLALKGKINSFSKFDRKNYFYPDLPKGYQISQYDLPFVYDAKLEANEHEIKITRIHLEEDTGKLTHPAKKDYSLVDYNRAGTPLMEMVTEPVIPDAKTAKKFCQNFQQILKYLNISNANMEKGEMRCEANISVQEKGKWEYKGNCEIKPKKGYKLNPKIEVKNINSFKAVEKAIEYEIKRQIKAIEENEALKQETRGWDEDKGKTFSQRSKETSADYRYFPDPDIPPISIDGQWIKKIKTDLIELPLDKKKRFIEQYSFLPENAEILVSNKKLADYTEQVISELRAWIDSNGDSWERQKKKLARAASNWIINNLFNFLNGSNDISEIKITPENMAELISLVYLEKINSSSAQKILKIMFEKGGDPTNIMDELGLEQVDNNEELSEEIKKIIKNNSSQVEEYKNGKENIMQYFVGQTMAATKGKANPKKIIEILKKELK
jgi:aspartyl-tRNA(Asn)/glutamyl-tRNA(Gln) amidotransferase subunit B